MIEVGAIALLLSLIMIGYIALFGYVAMHVHKLLSLVSNKRTNRKFFKKIERFRRDFS